MFLDKLNTLADWEISFLTSELVSKRYFKNQNEDVTILKVGSTKAPIKTLGGMIINPDITVNEMDINDLLILPGADTWFEQDNQKIIKVAKDRIEKGLKIAAICGATGALAKAGALNNKKHTSNDIEYLKMFSPEYTGEAYYVNEPVIKDENLITASGLAPIEFTYEIIKQLDLFSEETLSAWYNLYIKKEQKYFYELMSSLKK
ncbi:glutamine amidotransferase [Methanobacterium sp. MZ-A1]|uniref:Glutamine amidotransferase n=1 Tax=Methanobacterium subterraneum TaxID=59277 RepID=A0A2H4VDY0_9EURY|nr:glutamine amidotransferase [Methanobacterium subterraneum]AUB58825.1 glutamine amidotransferase [Methanobacterium sp. MZ-A1]